MTPEQWGESDETFRILYGHVNFSEMNGGISLVITTNTLRK